MLNWLTGVVQIEADNSITLNMNGVGYHIRVPTETLQHLRRELAQDCPGQRLLIVEVCKQDTPTALFGFRTEAERELFRALMKVERVGPKVALAVMSLGAVNDIKAHIRIKDWRMLTNAAGVSETTAKNICLSMEKALLKELQ